MGWRPLVFSVLMVVVPVGIAGQVSDSLGKDIPLPEALRRAYANGTRDSTGTPGPTYWQIETNYRLRARLDSATSLITGSGSVLLRNRSPSALTTIQLRLDQNRFRRGSNSAGDLANPTDGMVVTSLSVDGINARIGTDTGIGLPSLSGTSSTSERLTLAKPVPPGDSITLTFEWYFEVPRDPEGDGLRLGRWGSSVYQVAQWYPRIAMFDDLSGWDMSPYEGPVEFYNPYGRFEVELDVPGGWLVGATGVLTDAEEVLSRRTRNRLAHALETDSTVTIAGSEERGRGQATLPGERLTWRFVADSVRDFAWGTSSQYEWKATSVRIPGGALVLVQLLYTPRNASNFATAASILRHGLVFNSVRISPYPYSQFTLVDGPEGGMEYPMLTMSDGTRLDHELWHQWFPITVGSNETLYSFMDEGFATYLAGVTAAARSGSESPRWAASPAMQAPLIWPDDRGPPSVLAAVYGYGRPARMFTALADAVGQDSLLAALGGYAKIWRFKHPSPWDLMFFMNQALGRDLSGFWYRWLFTTS